MADWLNNPNLTQTYSAFVSSIRARDVDSAVMFNGTGTNPPDQSVRWNDSASVFQIYSSTTTSWSPISPKLETLSVASAPTNRTLIQIDIYESSGVWNKPEGCTLAEIWCVGGGGGGGAARVAGGGKVHCAAAGGGGGGGMAYAIKSGGVLNSVASVAVGAGGEWGAVSSAGEQGEDTWFQDSTFLRGGGGYGGNLALSSATKPLQFGGGGAGGGSFGSPNPTLRFLGVNGTYGTYIEYSISSSYVSNRGCGGYSIFDPGYNGYLGVDDTTPAQFAFCGSQTGTNATRFGQGGRGGVVICFVTASTVSARGGNGYQGICIVKSYT